jgi:phosphoglycerate dehydrogenase-like enzyme
MPDSVPAFEDAVRAAGGELVPLSAETRGIVWVANDRPEVLTDALERFPGIGWVQLPWAGVDAFADVLARFSGDDAPIFTSAKGAYSEPVAEQALALTLATLRRYPNKARTSTWERPKQAASLYGCSVLIVGAGGIAVELIRLLAPFETEVTVVRRSDGELAGASRTVTSDRLLEVLPEADVVVLAAASTTGTKHLIGARELEAMKSDAVLVNIARGALVDSDALVAALESGSIAGAGLDVTDPEPLPDEHPLWTVRNCIVTSHTADTEAMTEPLLAGRIAANTRAFLDTGAFVGVVDARAGY